MSLNSRNAKLLGNTNFEEFETNTWEQTQESTRKRVEWTMFLYETLGIIFVELMNSTDLSDKSEIWTIKEIHKRLLNKNYPWITKALKEKLEKWLIEKNQILSEMWLDLKSYIAGKLSEWPEAFLSSLIKELEIDFYNPTNMEGVKINPNNLKDIPIQAKEAREAWVPGEFNATIWVLKDEKWNIVANPRILEVFKNNLGLNKEDINNILNYQPWPWMEVFRLTMEALIKREEFFWSRFTGNVTKPYFIPGWWGWLTIAWDYFLEEWDLVIVPNYRWPNIDWIVTNKTKLLATEIDFIKPDWKINFNSLDLALKNARASWRKKATIYLNFPWNPTGTNLSTLDVCKLNDTLNNNCSNLFHIQIIVDDPYWAFSLTSDSKKLLKEDKEKPISRLQSLSHIISQKKERILRSSTPLSYEIDTGENLTVIELWSHWTKEAGVYWLRAWLLRVFTSERKIKETEVFLNKAVRETFSMSPSLPQIALIKAILWEDIEIFKSSWKDWVKKFFDNLWEKEINRRIDRYLQARTKMLKVIYPKLWELKQEIVEKCGEYLIPMENRQSDWCNGSIEHTWGFVLNFTLTDKAKEEWLDLEELRKFSIIGPIQNKIAFTTFKDNMSSEKSIRISLMAWDPKDFAQRLNKNINDLLKNKEANKNLMPFAEKVSEILEK